MSGTAKPAIESLGIVKGHYECNYLHKTVPVLSELLALEVVETHAKQVTMKHPNTDWLLVVHESGPGVPDKPFRNQYGVRVKNNEQVDRAYQYLVAKKDQLGLKKVVMRNERAGSYSVFFVEPGGNYWEIESYEHRHQAGLPDDVAYPWKTELSQEQFPGRGYLPHGFTHGTIECSDWASSVKFYKAGLGMDVITHVQTTKPHNIKHPANSWYVVSLEVPEKNRKYPSPLQRFTIAVASEEKLQEARENLSTRRSEFAITEIGDIQSAQDGQSFMLCDLNKNWWEIAAPCRHSRDNGNPGWFDLTGGTQK
jgi:catechol 2,3-dioxygenase-like lactoylglutathione lyase family enzyme